MFLGHFALAMAAKRAVPKASLGMLVLSAQFADCLWPVLLLLGIEQVRMVPGITRVTPLDFVSYPISHSLLMEKAAPRLPHSKMASREKLREAANALVLEAA